jgi:hypothetical protein
LKPKGKQKPAGRFSEGKKLKKFNRNKIWIAKSEIAI